MESQEKKETNAETGSVPVEYKFENHTVRTIAKDDEIWFVAADVCEVLEVKNPTDAINRLDNDERALDTIEGIPGGQAVNIINESGLYNLIFTSRKPQAKAFKRWVTHEVLPAIHKTRRYEAQQKTGAEEAPRNSSNTSASASTRSTATGASIRRIFSSSCSAAKSLTPPTGNTRSIWMKAAKLSALPHPPRPLSHAMALSR
jgi:prophage antirepressor-like protein